MDGAVKRRKTEDVPEKCAHCDKIFESNASLVEHLQMIYQQSSEPQRGDSSGSKSVDIHEHPSSSKGKLKERTFKCYICEEFFSSKFILHKHKFDCSKRHVCGHCGLIFKQENSLIAHLKCVYGETAALHCSYCDEIFENDDGESDSEAGFKLQEHVTKSHSDVLAETSTAAFVCERCDNKFASKYEYWKHQRFVCYQRKVIYNCGHCDRIFKNKYFFLKHLKFVYFQNAKLQCKYCNDCFRNPHDVLEAAKRFENHVETVHPRKSGGAITESKREREKKDSTVIFNCFICKKSFDDDSRLIVHMDKCREDRINTKNCVPEDKDTSTNRGRKCSFCKKIFDDQYLLIVHMDNCRKDSIDTRNCVLEDSKKCVQDEKDTNPDGKCSICKKTFEDDALLRIHTDKCRVDLKNKMISAQKKMFSAKCSKCMTSFDNDHDLKLHTDICSQDHTKRIDNTTDRKSTEVLNRNCFFCKKNFDGDHPLLMKHMEKCLVDRMNNMRSITSTVGSAPPSNLTESGDAPSAGFKDFSIEAEKNKEGNDMGELCSKVEVKEEALEECDQDPLNNDMIFMKDSQNDDVKDEMEVKEEIVDDPLNIEDKHVKEETDLTELPEGFLEEIKTEYIIGS